MLNSEAFEFGKYVGLEIGGMLKNPEALNPSIEPKASPAVATFSPTNSVTRDNMNASILKNLTNPFNYVVDVGYNFGKKIFQPAEASRGSVDDGITDVYTSNSAYTPAKPVSKFTVVTQNVIKSGNTIANIVTSGINVYDRLRAAISTQVQDSNTNRGVNAVPNTIALTPNDANKIVDSMRNTAPTSGFMTAVTKFLSFTPPANTQIQDKKTFPDQGGINWLMIALIVLVAIIVAYLIGRK